MSVTIPVLCNHYDECAGKSVTRCRKCVNNRMRNKEIDYFEEANDKPFPEVNPKLTYAGPAEQTAGYKCPVCDEYTSPYHVKPGEPRCGSCGFKLNI